MSDTMLPLDLNAALAEASVTLPDSVVCTLDGLTATRPDGKQAALDKCDWVHIAACGCISGVSVAVAGTDVLMTVEAALKWCYPLKRDLTEKMAHGVTAKLILHEDFSVLTEAWKGKCPHDNWGEPRIERVVDGITFKRELSTEWTAKSAVGRWRIEKYGSGWYPSDPRPIPKGGSRRVPFLGRTLDEALPKAAEIIAEADEEQEAAS